MWPSSALRAFWALSALNSVNKDRRILVKGRARNPEWIHDSTAEKHVNVIACVIAVWSIRQLYKLALEMTLSVNQVLAHKGVFIWVHTVQFRVALQIVYREHCSRKYGDCYGCIGRAFIFAFYHFRPNATRDNLYNKLWGSHLRTCTNQRLQQKVNLVVLLLCACVVIAHFNHICLTLYGSSISVLEFKCGNLTLWPKLR